MGRYVVREWSGSVTRVDESSTRTGCVATEGPRLDYTCLYEVDFSEPSVVSTFYVNRPLSAR